MEISARLPDSKPFYLDEYLTKHKKTKDNIPNNKSFASITDKETRFHSICEAVLKYFQSQWELEQGVDGSNSVAILERQRKAIIGYEAEVNYFKDKIYEYLRANNLLNEWYPDWYENLTDAIFHENWGLAGIIQWKRIPECTSAKIIGDRIYFLIEGKQVLQEQRISLERFEKLRKALLLRTPKKRLDESYSEVYMQSGERITVYNGDLTWEDQPVMVFRKYVVEHYNFEEQARRGTIPYIMIPMLKAMAQIGYNVNFAGPVRSGKTTWLTIWQTYEDPSLEGVLVQTDPEIPIHKIMPTAPIMQLIADGEDLIKITKSLMRSDADYLIMAEARDAYALNLAVEIANKGTNRCKSTTHLTDVNDFCYDIANKIISVIGGNLEYTIIKVAKSFHYVFELTSLRDRSQKRLKGIYEIRYDRQKHIVTVHRICKYDFSSNTWSFAYDIGDDKRELALEENYEAFKIFDMELKKLSELSPMIDNNVTVPFYGHSGR